MVEDIFERAEMAQEESTETVENYAEKYAQYMKKLLSLGKVKMTESKSGYKRYIAEKTYDMLDIPVWKEDDPQDGVWKDSFISNKDNGGMIYVVYFMKNADIELATETAIKAGLPAPEALNNKVDRLAKLYG